MSVSSAKKHKLNLNASKTSKPSPSRKKPLSKINHKCRKLLLKHNYEFRYPPSHNFGVAHGFKNEKIYDISVRVHITIHIKDVIDITIYRFTYKFTRQLKTTEFVHILKDETRYTHLLQDILQPCVSD